MVSIRRSAWLIALLVLAGLTVGSCKKPPEEGRPKGKAKTKFIVTDADLAEAAVIAILADHFGWDLNLVIKVRREGDLGPEDLVALFVLLNLAGSRDVDLVVGLRGEGHGWGVIAHRLGIQPSVFNQLRRRVLGALAALRRGKWESDKDFGEGLFIIVLSDYFGVEAPTIYQRFEKGNSLADLVLALAFGKKIGVEWVKVMDERKKEGKSWLEEAEALGVDLGDLDAVERAVKAPPKENHSSKGKGKGG